MMITIIVGHVLAVGIGLSLGLVGGGGSILAVPILIYVMGMGTQTAIATSLAIVSVVSLIGAITHWTQGNVNLRATLFFTPAAMIGTYLGARLTALPFITSTTQLFCFSLVMFGVSILMIRKGQRNVSHQPAVQSAIAQSQVVRPPTRSNRSTDEATLVPESSPAGTSAALSMPESLLQHWSFTLAQGLVVGVFTGFAGIGGGFLIIPTLVLLAGLPVREAIGTALLVIAAKSVTGFLGYLDHVSVDWGLILSFTLAASIGKALGLYISQFLDARHLQKGLGYVVSIVALLVLTQAIALPQ